MDTHNLIDTASMLVAGDKRLLAMDEGYPACNERSARLVIHKTKRGPARLSGVCGTTRSGSSNQVQPGCTPWRIKYRNGKNLGMKTKRHTIWDRKNSEVE